MAKNSAQYDVRLAFSADVAQARQQLKSLQDELSKLSTLKNVNVGTRLTKELEQASLKAADLKVMLEKATDINTGKLNLTSFSNQLTKNGESLSTYRKALSALGPQGEEAFLQLTQSVITADAALTTGSKKLNELKKTLANTVRWQISSSMMHSFIGGIETAYNYAKDLDRALTDIKIVTEDSTGAMANFAERANKAAQALSTTTKDYAQASLIYYQQGLNDKEVEARTAVTIKMANAAGESASKVSDQLTAVWNNFYDGSKSLEYYADVMTKLGAYTASSTDEISEGIQKFASVANTIGLSYEYATSALATLTAKTRESANTVGNSLKTLFARIQGLTLGETLEDGTDLNKYSKALEKVGISIKDQQGELKDMNTILDEMMNKWDSLSRAEKVALAQTVGGVRQYTQLVNLMENKDYFKELVGVAENSEGTLQLQADIYAKSWEGARKRVQAAAEGIYDSLIDEEFFKDVDNIVAGVLNGINATIKGLGGVKGVLANVGALLTNIYRKDLSSGLSTFGNMIYGLTSKGQAAIESRRQEALNEQKKIYTLGMEELGSSIWERGNNSEDISRYSSYEKLAEIEQKLLNISKNLTEEEQKKAGLYLDQLKAVQDREIAMGRILDQNRNSLQQAATGLNTGNIGLVNRQWINQVTNTYDEMVGMAKTTGTMNQAKATAFDPQNQQNKIKDVKLMQSMIDRMQELGDKANFSFANDNSKSLSALSSKLQLLIKDLEQGTASADKFNEALNEMKILTSQGAFGKTHHTDDGEEVVEVSGAKQEAQNAAYSINTIFDLPSQTEAYDQQLNQIEQNTQRYIQANQNTQRANENVGESFEEMALKVATTSDRIVAISGALFSLSSFSTSISGMFDVFSSKSLTGLEKAVGFFNSFTLIIPNAINLYKQLNTVMRTSNLIQQAQNAINQQSTSGLSGLIAQMGYKALAHKRNAAAMTAEAAAATGLKTATLGLTTVISLLVMGLTALSEHIKKVKESRAEFAETTKETYEQTKQEIEENEKLITSYQELLENYGKTGQGKADLVNASMKLIDVFDIENGSLLLLQGNYEELTNRILEAKHAKDTFAVGEAKTAYAAANDTVKDELGSDIGTYWDIASKNAGENQGSRLQIAHIGGSDYDIMQQYLNSVEGSSNWTVKNFQGNGAFDIANVIDFYDNAIINIQQFSEWAQKEIADGGLGWTEEQTNEYLQESRTSLVSMKNLVEGWRDLLNDTNAAILNSAMNEYDESQVKDLPSYLKQRAAFSSQKDNLEVGYSSDADEIISNYLGTNSKTSDYELLLNGLQSWYDQYSSFLPDFEKIINSGLSDEELKILVNIDPRITGGSLEDLQKQIQKYLKVHPVDISADIKAGKKALKEDMSGKNDWKDFWEATSNITWGENGIVSQASFQKMQYGQQQKYLNELYSQNAQTFSPEERIQRATQENIELEQQINNLKGLSDEQVIELQRGHLTDEQNKAYYDFSEYEAQINKLLEAYRNSDNYGKYNDSSWYEDMLFSNTAFDNPDMYNNWVETLIARIGGAPENFIKPKVTAGNNLIEGRDTKRNLESQRQGFKEDNITQLEKEQAENTRELQNALIDYNTEISRTIQNLANTDLKIGDIIQPEQAEALKAIDINLDDYFIQMEDGTYKLITAAEEFNRVVGKASIEHAYDDVDTLLKGIYGTDSPISLEHQRETQYNRANKYLNYSKEELSNIGDATKTKYIESMGLDPDDYTDNLEQGVLDAAQKFVDLINGAEYRIDATILGSNNMLDLDKNAKAAGIDTTDKRYTDAMINMASEAGIEYDATVTAVIDAQSKYDEAINEYGEDSELAKKAAEDLGKAQENLAKNIRTIQFYKATEDLANYMKTLKTTKDNTEKMTTATKAAEAISKAFGKTVNSSFVLDKENQKLIDKLINGTQKQRNEAAYKIDLKINNTEFTNDVKDAIEDASGKAGEEINKSFATQFEQVDLSESITNGMEQGVQTGADAVRATINSLNGLTFNTDGSINMDNTSAVNALQGLQTALGNTTGEAGPLAGILSSILQTSMTLDSSQIQTLVDFLTDLFNALQGDTSALENIASKGASQLTNAGIDITGMGPGENEWTNITTKSPSGGGGGSSSKKSAADIGKEIQDELLKTKEKKRDRLEALREGANPEDSAKYIQEEIKLLEEEQDILEDQIKSWKKLLKLKVEEFNKDHPEFEIKLTDDGEIANASELWGQVWAEYEKNVENGMSKEDLNEWFTKIKNGLDGPMSIQERIDENVAAIAQKEKEAAELELEAITKQIDWKVKQIDFQIKRLNYYQEKLLKQAHGNKQTIEAMLEGFAYQEQEMLQLFDKGATLRQGIDELNAAKARHPGYEQMFDEQILEYQSDLIDVNEAILDLRNDIEDLVQNVLDLALDEIDKQIERLDTYTSMLDHLNNIIDLSGRSMLDMGLKTQIGATKVETMLGKMKSLKAQMDGLTKATKEAQAALADRQADGDTSSVKFWENQVEVLKQETEKASDEFLASWEETLEAAQDLFEMRVEMAVNILSNALSPFETLEDFQDKYEKAKTINEEYLDDAERLYELNKLNRQLNLQLADANDLLAKQKLRDIQQEIHDLQADGVKMSQYDLEYLQKKYDLQLAEIALMEQQNSKTSMRLVRDAAGNWTYAYDADEEKIEDATQKYEDAVHELGQLSKDYINDVSEQLIQNQIDFKEALQDLDKNSADYSNQLLSLQEYYVERQRYLLDELNKGVVNSGLTFHDTLYGQMTDLYDYNDAYMQFVNNSNTTITELQTNYKDWQKVVETAMGVAGTSWDNFGTDMGGTLDSLEEHIQRLCDEIEELVNVLMGYISQSIGMVLDWEQKYSKRTDQELAANEAYIDGNFVGGGGGGGYGDVDMQTDFTALAQRWAAGERNLTNYNGTKTYNSLEEIKADLDKKLDAFEKGADILFQGSGEAFDDEAYESVYNNIYQGTYKRNGNNYGMRSYPNTTSNSIVDKASNYLGVRYRWGGTDAGYGLDCSGLVYNALNDAGISVPRTSAQGYRDMSKPIKESSVKPGDLVFFGYGNTVDHVGIYAGNGQMIDAPGAKVQYTNIDEKRDRLLGYGRLGNTNYASSDTAALMDRLGLSRRGGAASGAYTGDWGPGQGIGIDNGKIIKVHPKELILNKSDTRNILRAVDIVRNMNDWVDKQVQQMSSISSSKLDSLFNSAIPRYEAQPIKQEVTIQADFPGVTDHYEIEEALSNLSNNAAQYISANRSK